MPIFRFVQALKFLCICSLLASVFMAQAASANTDWLDGLESSGVNRAALTEQIRQPADQTSSANEAMRNEITSHMQENSLTASNEFTESTALREPFSLVMGAASCCRIPHDDMPAHGSENE